MSAKVQFDTYQHCAQPRSLNNVGPMSVPSYRTCGCYNPIGLDTVSRTRLSDNCCYGGNYQHGFLDKSHDFSVFPSMMKCSKLQVSENSAFEPYKKPTPALPQSTKCFVLPIWEESSRPKDVLEDAVQEEIEPKGNIDCTLCNKRFARPQTLEVHMRIHRGEKPYRCRYCCKSFSRAGNRDVHMRIHTGEKPCICNECGKCFRHRSTLRNHLKIHKKNKQAIM